MRRLRDPGFLTTGVASLLLHMGFILFLSFSLKPAITRGGPSVYRVTLRPFLPPENGIRQTRLNPDLDESLPIPSPLLTKTQIRKEENKSIPEIRETRPIVSEKKQEQVIPLPDQFEVIRVPQEEQKQLSPYEKEEEKVVEPVPLPMADVSPLNTALDLNEEDKFPDLLRFSSLGEQYMNPLPGTGSGNGPGAGSGGSGSGQGGPGLGSGDGSGPGRGKVGRGGSQEGVGIGQGGSGLGSGDGSGPGRKGSGTGGSGKGGAGVPYPRYGKNPKPVYPQEAREKGYQGEVLLRVEVLPNGRVGQVEVRRSSGHEVLDQSALATVKQWSFIPAKKGEVAIPFWVNIPIKFQLL